jgi:hypothetical protein
VDLDVEAEQVAHDSRVVGRPVEGGVAGDRGDAEEFRVSGRGDDGDDIVVARVAVEDDGWGALAHPAILARPVEGAVVG